MTRRPHCGANPSMMSAGGLTRHRSTTATSKPVPQQVPVYNNGKNRAHETPPFEPCAATASLFLYSQGSVVICLHHDTLAVERKFQKHTENIQFISVDNVSERGAGR